MLKRLTQFERQMLPLAVPCLRLPALENPTDIDLWERAAALDYGAGMFVNRGDDNLKAWLMILDVIPSRLADRLARIRLAKRRIK